MKLGACSRVALQRIIAYIAIDEARDFLALEPSDTKGHVFKNVATLICKLLPELESCDDFEIAEKVINGNIKI